MATLPQDIFRLSVLASRILEAIRMLSVLPKCLDSLFSSNHPNTQWAMVRPTAVVEHPNTQWAMVRPTAVVEHPNTQWAMVRPTAVVEHPNTQWAMVRPTAVVELNYD